MMNALFFIALLLGQTFTFTSASANSYTTAFPSTENPISEGGRWIGGLTTGLDWRNVRTTPGLAFGATNVTGYDDNLALLTTSWGPLQYAQGTVYRAGGYAPGVSHEIELLLHFSITANNAHGYEVLWSTLGHIAVVRWNGPVGDYTPLLDNVAVGQAATGDVMRVEIDGSGVITVKINGVLVGTAPADTTWTTGQPGIGFWPTAGTTLASYGWSAFTAGEVTN